MEYGKVDPCRGKVLNWPLHARGASRQYGKVQGCILVKPVFAALPAWMPRMNWGTRSTVALSEGLLCLGWALLWPSSADRPSRKNARKPQSSQPLQNEVVMMPLLGPVSRSRNSKATIISSQGLLAEQCKWPNLLMPNLVNYHQVIKIIYLIWNNALSLHCVAFRCFVCKKQLSALFWEL